MSSTPPGWYDDGSNTGTQRWWNGDTWTEHTQPAQPTQSFLPQATQSMPPGQADPFAQPVVQPVVQPFGAGGQHGQHGRPAKKGWTKGKVVGAGLGALFLVGAVGAAIDGPDDPSTVTVASDSSSGPAAKPSSAPAAKPSTSTAAAKPAPTKTTPKPASKPSTSKTTATPKPAPKVVFKKITDRQWKVISKDPDSHVGETYVVYGYVTQFDSITGSETFLGNVGGVRHSEWYEYDTNTILGGSKAALSKVVEDDIFRAEVMVVGTTKYETAMGAETTVPTLAIMSIKVIGSTA